MCSIKEFGGDFTLHTLHENINVGYLYYPTLPYIPYILRHDQLPIIFSLPDFRLPI